MQPEGETLTAAFVFLTQSAPAYRRITAALFAGALATYASLYTTQPLLPLLSAALQITPTMASLLVLRGLEGFVLAGLPATAMAYLAEEIDPRALGAAMGLYVSGNTVAGVVGLISLFLLLALGMAAVLARRYASR